MEREIMEYLAPGHVISVSNILRTLSIKDPQRWVCIKGVRCLLLFIHFFCMYCLKLRPCLNVCKPLSTAQDGWLCVCICTCACDFPCCVSGSDIAWLMDVVTPLVSCCYRLLKWFWSLGPLWLFLLNECIFLQFFIVYVKWAADCSCLWTF